MYHESLRAAWLDRELKTDDEELKLLEHLLKGNG